MSKKISKRKAAQAKKAAAKRARYEARKDKDTSNSKCAERRRARNRGVPMSSRSHESAPWWDRGIRGSFGAFIEKSAVAARA